MNVFSIFVLFLIIAASPSSAVTSGRAAFDGVARGHVERVIDGDTVKMRVAIWLDQELLVSVRIANIDAPELFRPSCERERALAREAKQFVEWFLASGEAELLDIKRGKYAGRVVARVESNGADLGQALVRAGLAVEGANGEWCATVPD